LEDHPAESMSKSLPQSR